MKTDMFKITSLCHAVVLGNNRGLDIYYKGDIVARIPSIARCGGLKSALKEARMLAYKRVNH